MKEIVFIQLMLFSLIGVAVEIKIIGPCEEHPLIQKNIDISLNSENVGQLTVKFLTLNHIPFSGSDAGIHSINNSPIGDAAIEVISNTKLRAYGWCFDFNGNSPDKMPNEIIINSNNDYILWYYAFSTYDNGNWIDYCVPSYKIRPKQFCK